MIQQDTSANAGANRRGGGDARQLAGRYFIPILIGVMGLGLSLGMALIVRESRAVRIRGEFEELSESRFRAVQNSINRNLVALSSLQSLFTSFEEVTRQQFAEFSHLLLNQVPGIQALEWIPRVDHVERERYESAARSEGYENFQFTVRNEAGDMVRAPIEEAYYPVYYLEPLKGNEKAFGFNLASDTDRLTALRRSQDTGQAVATRKIHLVQESSESFGFLLFLPAYKKAAMINAVQDRRQNLQGFALGVFRVSDIVEGALGPSQRSGASFFLHDRTESKSGGILYPSESPSNAAPQQDQAGGHSPDEELRAERTLDVGGRRWVMACVMTEKTFRERLGLQHWMVLATGLALTGLLTAYFFIKIKGENVLRGALSQITALKEQAVADKQILQTLFELTEQINSDLVLEQILDHVYESFSRIVPYDRIGLAFIKSNQTVRAYWVRSEEQAKFISHGYSAPLKGSSLQAIIETGKPRVLNNLLVYLKEHPESESTRLIVEEGMRSSLTCPLIAAGKPVGFIFFSSKQLNAYQDSHVNLFTQIASQLSMTVEKSRMLEELLELNQLKNKFLGMAAHDLRSPITIIKGHLDLLESGIIGTLSEDGKTITEVTKRACEKMLKLIDDLLDVSMIEAGRLDIDAKEIDLYDYLKENYEYNSALARMKSIELILDVPPELVGATVTADPHRLDQVINNLIANAIKFSRPKTTVKLGVKERSDQIEIYVSDRGQGIRQEEIDAVFSEFSTTSTRPTHGEKSTGLGLAIAKQIIESHGGDIRVESEAGVGSTFTFSISRKGRQSTTNCDR